MTLKPYDMAEELQQAHERADALEVVIRDLLNQYIHMVGDGPSVFGHECAVDRARNALNV